MIKKEKFTVRKIADHHVMIPIGLTAHKLNGMIVTTETGAFIWEHIEEVNSPEEMANLLIEEFEVSYEEALADVTVLFDNFQKAGWIE